MKRDFLKNLDLGEGAKLPDAAVEAIIAEHGRSTAELRTSIQTLTQERDTARGQLKTAQDEAAKYSDYADIKAQRDALQRDIDTRNIRDKVSADTGVPANLLTGDTEEACKAQAEALTQWRGTMPGYPDTHDGGETTPPAGGSTAEQFETWFRANTNQGG